MPDDNPIGIGAQLRGATRRLDRDAVAVVIEATGCLGHRDLDLVETVERARVGDQAGPLGLEDFPYGLVDLLGCLLHVPGQAARCSQRELITVGKVQPRRKQMLARVADLVST